MKSDVEREVIQTSKTVTRSVSHWLALTKMRFSKFLSLSLARLCDITKPAVLNSLSTAALAGSGVSSLLNKSFSCGHEAILFGSSDGDCKY
jgi:hypothetical protein